MYGKELLFSQVLEMRAYHKQMLESKFCMKTCVLTKLLRMLWADNSEQKGPYSEHEFYSQGRGWANKFCDSVAFPHFAVGISFLSSLAALRKILISKEAKSSSESYCISSFTSMLLILSNIFFFDGAHQADTAHALQSRCPCRAGDGGTVSLGGSGAPRCSGVFAPLEGAHAFE